MRTTLSDTFHIPKISEKLKKCFINENLSTYEIITIIKRNNDEKLTVFNLAIINCFIINAKPARKESSFMLMLT